MSGGNDLSGNSLAFNFPDLNLVNPNELREQIISAVQSRSASHGGGGGNGSGGSGGSSGANVDTAAKRRQQNKLAQQRLRDKKREEKRELEKKAASVSLKEAELNSWRREVEVLSATVSSQRAKIEELQAEIAQLRAAGADSPVAVKMELATPVNKARTGVVAPIMGSVLGSGVAGSSVGGGTSSGGAGGAGGAGGPGGSGGQMPSSVLAGAPRMSRAAMERAIHEVQKALRKGGKALEDAVANARRDGFWARGSPVRPEVNPCADDGARLMQFPHSSARETGRRNSAPAMFAEYGVSLVPDDLVESLGWSRVSGFRDLGLSKAQMGDLIRYRKEFLQALRRIFFERASLNKVACGLLKNGCVPVEKPDDLAALERSLASLNMSPSAELPAVLSKLYENLQMEIRCRARFEEIFFEILTTQQIAKLMISCSSQPKPSPIMVANSLLACAPII